MMRASNVVAALCGCITQAILQTLSAKLPQTKKHHRTQSIVLFVFCCEGRTRTFTGRLAIAQNGGQPLGRFLALCYVCSGLPTPETRGHGCQKFHHLTMLFFDKEYGQRNLFFSRFFASLLPKIAKLVRFDEAKLKTSLHLCKFFKEIS